HGGDGARPLDPDGVGLAGGGGHLDRRQARRDRRSGVSGPLPRVRRGFRLVPGRPAPLCPRRRAQRWLANRRGGLEGGERSVRAPIIGQLVATPAGASSPAWDRLTEIAKERTAGR